MEVASKDKLVVTAAAAAHAKQDCTPATATVCPVSAIAAVKDTLSPDAAAQPTKANAAAATEAQALASKPAVSAWTQSLTGNVAAQVSQGVEPADAPVTEGPNSDTAKPLPAAASPDAGGPSARNGTSAVFDGSAAPSGPPAPGGPTAPAPDSPTAADSPTPAGGSTAHDGPMVPGGPIAHDGPIAPADPPASTTNNSSKKRKQAKQPSKGAAGGAASQRKRKKPPGSKVKAGDAGTNMGNQGEARTSVSTMDYTAGEASSTPPWRCSHDGEVASPHKDRAKQHAGPDADSEKIRPPPVADTSHSKPQKHPREPDSGPQLLGDNPKQHPFEPESKSQQHVHEPGHSLQEHRTAEAFTAAQHMGSTPAGAGPPAPVATHKDTHMQAATSTPPWDAPPAQEPPPAAHMQAADPTLGGLPPQQQSTLQADDRVGQKELGNALQQHGQEQRQDTAQQPQELSQQQQQQSKQQQQQSEGQLSQPAPGKRLDLAQDEQLTPAAAECQRQKDTEVIRRQ